MLDELWTAWQMFRRGKKPSYAIDKFVYHIERNLADLARDIEQRVYCHGPYQKLTVTEKKRRDLAVAGVRDRVVHRYVYDQLVKQFDASFDPDVWSCRGGKGLHKALARTQALLAKYPDSYVWRADIRKFFEHVDHARLLQAIERRVAKESELFWLCEQIIASHTVTDRQVFRLAI